MAMSFVKQGTWMVLCTTVAGVFMFGVHGIVPLMGADAYSLYGSLLAIFQCMAIPAAGLQSVFALETASARDQRGRQKIAGNLVGVLAILSGAWLLCGGVLWMAESWLVAKLKMGDARALWVTLCVILPHLWLPVLSGVLQGRQLFGWLGWTILGNGLGRFLTVGLVFLTVGGAVHWIMVGPLIGVLLALGLATVACRDVLSEGIERVSWGRWLWRALPFALGPGVFQFMLLADNVAARVNLGELESGYYLAASMVGRALVMFMGPIAGVMFPKLVRETSVHKGAKLVKDTALATLLVVIVTSGLGVAGGFVFPSVYPVLVSLDWLPEGLIAGLAAKESQLHWIAHWAPMFLLAMGPLAISNVYISQLVANEQFRKIGVLGLIAVVYGLGLAYIPFSVGLLVLWVGLGNLGILAGAFLFSQKMQRVAMAE